MERQLSKEAASEEEKKTGKKRKKAEDDPECKKTQAQRLFEFELWTDAQAIRDLEYSQRRTEKKQRRKKAARDRRWKKLYVPAMLAMLGGTVLTLCGTLRSMGRDTILWEARDVLIIVGPVVLGLGFLCLMVAAGCTFEHDQHRDKDTTKDLFSEFLLDSFDDQADGKLSRPRCALRSVSMDTADLPIPEDLDPNKNYLEPESAWTVGRHGKRKESTGSTVFLDASNSYNSTASWVRSVSALHSSKHTLSRQNSDSNLLAGRSEQNTVPRRSLHMVYSGVKDPEGSHCDLHVVCTRSLTSSGYQSASDSTTGAAENHVSSENSAGVDVVFTSPTLRQASRQAPSSDAAPKTLVQKPNLAKHRPGSAAYHRPHHKAMADSGVRPGHAHPRGYRTPSCPRHPFTTRRPSASGGGSAQDRWKKLALAAQRKDPYPRRTVSISSYMETGKPSETGPPGCSEGGGHDVVQGEQESGSEKPPVALEPIVYTVTGIRCTEV